MIRCGDHLLGENAGEPSPPNDGSCDAHLDPWCHVELRTEEAVLFGFALVHPKTGGLSWMSSSHVTALDMGLRTATTRSGRRYLLGRCFKVVDVSGEGQEARAAFEALLGEDAEAMEEIRILDAEWVKCCKMARYLKIDPPARTGADVREFIKQNGPAYLRLRM